MSQSREKLVTDRTKPCFRAICSIFGPKIHHYGPNEISNEKNFNIIFNISWFPIIMQKIEQFPRANLEKMVQNPVFGTFLAFSGQKSAIIGQIKYPMKQILTSFPIYHGFLSLCKK